MKHRYKNFGSMSVTNKNYTSKKLVSLVKKMDKKSVTNEVRYQIIGL